MEFHLCRWFHTMFSWACKEKTHTPKNPFKKKRWTFKRNAPATFPFQNLLNNKLDRKLRAKKSWECVCVHCSSLSKTIYEVELYEFEHENVLGIVNNGRQLLENTRYYTLFHTDTEPKKVVQKTINCVCLSVNHFWAIDTMMKLCMCNQNNKVWKLSSCLFTLNTRLFTVSNCLFTLAAVCLH